MTRFYKKKPMQYLFDTPISPPWLLADILSFAITVLVIIFVIKKSMHPVAILLESLAFVLFYASVYENFAVVQGWYVYGYGLLMVGDVPLSVPLLEVDVLTSLVHWALLGWIYTAGRKIKTPRAVFLFRA
jgi:hypothetical protein